MCAKNLSVGVGTAEICIPTEVFPMEGFCGIHDLPHVRVVVIEGNKRIVLAAFELVNIMGDALDEVRNIISAKTSTDLENVWVHVTHAITTPHAPRDDQARAAAVNGAIFSAAEVAATAAAGAMKDAVMGVNTGSCDVNINRDVKTPAGWWIGFNPDGFSNKTATVIRFNDLEGKLITALISYGVKPCAIDNSEMEKNGRLVSSDVPGLACTLLEEQLGAPCLFFMSAAGDQIPKEQTWYDEVDADGTVRKIDNGVKAGLVLVDKYGKQMAQELLPIIDGTKCEESAPEIKLGSTSIRWAGKARAKMAPTTDGWYAPEGNHEVEAHIITIGDTALVAVKPETNAITERQLIDGSCYKNTVLMSMVNGGFKYMPDITSYENVTWEAQSSALMPGAAEAWVSAVCDALKNIKG